MGTVVFDVRTLTRVCALGAMVSAIPLAQPPVINRLMNNYSPWDLSHQ